LKVCVGAKAEVAGLVATNEGILPDPLAANPNPIEGVVFTQLDTTVPPSTVPVMLTGAVGLTGRGNTRQSANNKQMPAIL
jgi:hypothetical protein